MADFFGSRKKTIEVVTSAQEKSEFRKSYVLVIAEDHFAHQEVKELER